MERMTPTLWQEVRYFTSREFDSHDTPGSGDMMRPRTVLPLDALRGLLSKSFKINSGYRTEAHNKAVGGAPQSAHLSGEAVDVNTRGWTPEQRRDFVIYARKVGFNGIGIASTFIHIDIRPRIASWRYVGNKIVAIPLGDEVKFL